MTRITLPVGDYISVENMDSHDWLPLPTTKKEFLNWVKKNSIDDSSPLFCQMVRQYSIKDIKR